MNNKKTESKPVNKKTTAIKLGIYTLFVIVVAIYTFTNYNDIPVNTQDNSSNVSSNITNNSDNFKEIIKIPEKYNYTINITINSNKYRYLGTKESNKETITKEINEEVYNYKFENNNYYKEENNNYILTTKSEVYDIIDYNYLNLDNINSYLNKSIKNNNQYIIYLKDIILNNTSEEYIVVDIVNNVIDIDYTRLINNLDNTISKYYVKIEIEEIE